MRQEVKITKDDQVGYCLESAVEVWERHGWTRADDGSSKAPQDTAPVEADEVEDD